MRDILAALVPVIMLLALGVGAAIASRTCRLSPIVGYLLLGVGFKAAGINLVANSGTVALLADLGVVFLLFDIGLHFSLGHIRQQAADIFGFGPLQILFGTVLLGGLGWVAGACADTGDPARRGAGAELDCGGGAGDRRASPAELSGGPDRDRDPDLSGRGRDHPADRGRCARCGPGR